LSISSKGRDICEKLLNNARFTTWCFFANFTGYIKKFNNCLGDATCNQIDYIQTSRQVILYLPSELKVQVLGISPSSSSITAPPVFIILLKLSVVTKTLCTSLKRELSANITHIKNNTEIITQFREPIYV